MGGAKRLELRRTLCLYEGDGEALATVHPVRTQGGRKTLGPGQLLTRETLDEAVRKLAGLPQRREIIPERVLCADAGRLVWWSPQARRPIWFATQDAKFNRALNGRSVLQPALLFVAEPGRLAVLALATSERPTAETPVYRAPYFNLYHSEAKLPGSMCRGNAPYPLGLFIADLDVWEKCFYQTQFTHDCYGRQPLTLHPGGHNGLWRALAKPRAGAEWIRGQGQRFPVRWLAPLELTLAQVVNR